MQKVSSNYAPFTPVREVGMLVRFYIVDPSAKKNGMPLHLIRHQAQAPPKRSATEKPYPGSSLGLN